jgi:hypothetical protein
LALEHARSAEEPQDVVLNGAVTADNGSGISGTATVNIGDDGLRGRLTAKKLTPGHAYTVWLFYFQGTAQGGPGRFDSTVAEDSDFIFRGHVGGLRVSSGVTIELVIFDHPDLGPNSGTRANNLLTPQGGSMAAHAFFVVP